MALSKQAKKTWALSMVAQNPVDNSTDTSGYYVSKTLYNFWFEIRKFHFFTEEEPDDPGTIVDLFERLQLFAANIDPLIPQDPEKCLAKSWAKTKSRLADLSEAIGAHIAPANPPIEF